MFFFILILLLIGVLAFVNYRVLKYVILLVINYIIVISINHFLLGGKWGLETFELFVTVVLVSIIGINILKRGKFFSEGLSRYKGFNILKESIFILKKNLNIFRGSKGLRFADRFSILFSKSLNEFLKYSEGDKYGR